jgi:hypothetical protein
MESRDQRIYEEADALWREVFGEPPPAYADGSTLLAILTRRLDEVRYERLRSPFLRPSTIAGPGQPRDEAPRRH